MDENNGSSPVDRATAGPVSKDSTYQTTTTSARSRIASSASADADAAEMDRLARRYSRELQLAAEGLLYWAVRWPFELMASLVQAGRKWEEEYYRPAPKRRVSRYDDDTLP